MKMRKVVISILAISMLLLNTEVIIGAGNDTTNPKINNPEISDEQIFKKDKDQKENILIDNNDIKVLKLDYGVSVELEPDKPINLNIEWWHNFSLNMMKDLNTNITDLILSYSWGNQFFNFNISYSRSFLFDNKKIDNGKISFSFSQDF